MHSASTKNKAITVNYNSDWSGDVRITALNKTTGAFREHWLTGKRLLSGDFDRPKGCPLTERELRRAVALANWIRMTSHMVSAAENLPGYP